MNENKDELFEEGVENTEPSEEIKETEEVEAIEETEEIEDSSEAEKYVEQDWLIDEISDLRKRNKTLNKLCVLLSVILVVVVAGLGGYKVFTEVKNYNPYNNMGYPNFTGVTVGQFAQLNQVTVDEFIEIYNLPEDVKANTYLDVVDYLVPMSRYAEMVGADFETLKTYYNLSDEITPETTWGKAEDSITLATRVGEGDVLEEYIKEYDLDESVTGETTWGEVREKVLKKDYKDFIAALNGVEEEEEIFEEVVAPEENQPAEQETISEEELQAIIEALEAEAAAE